MGNIVIFIQFGLLMNSMKTIMWFANYTKI